jgi:hypothetical protein
VEQYNINLSYPISYICCPAFNLYSDYVTCSVFHIGVIIFGLKWKYCVQTSKSASRNCHSQSAIILNITSCFKNTEFQAECIHYATIYYICHPLNNPIMGHVLWQCEAFKNKVAYSKFQINATIYLPDPCMQSTVMLQERLWACVGEEGKSDHWLQWMFVWQAVSTASKSQRWMK